MPSTLGDRTGLEAVVLSPMGSTFVVVPHGLGALFRTFARAGEAKPGCFGLKMLSERATSAVK